MVEMSDWDNFNCWKRVLVYTPILSVLPIPVLRPRKSSGVMRVAPITPGSITPVVEGDVYSLVEEVSTWW